MRIPSITACVFAVLLGGIAPAGPARAEEGADPARALLDLVREDLPAPERVRAAGVILAGDALPDAEGVLRGATGLLGDAPETAGWLLLRATDAAWTPPRLRDAARAPRGARRA
jgi:hypothetical protein